MFYIYIYINIYINSNIQLACQRTKNRSLITDNINLIYTCFIYIYKYIYKFEYSACLSTHKKQVFFRSHLFTTNRVPYKLARMKLVSFRAAINRNNKLVNLLFN